ncbi:MAG: hypothetical protein NC350_03660 [Corallococcus sp.]|nr:hypothetical protein [Corallococcus sp.]MCM1290295.1 hypothetical protein [Corallococcus sp.]
MRNNEIEKMRIEKDINEIDKVFNAQFFDRSKAESIIRKHNTTDEVVGAFNSPLNPNVKPFYMLDDDTIKANLYLIRNYLVLKLAKE